MKEKEPRDGKEGGKAKTGGNTANKRRPKKGKASIYGSKRQKRE